MATSAKKDDIATEAAWPKEAAAARVAARSAAVTVPWPVAVNCAAKVVVGLRDVVDGNVVDEVSDDVSEDVSSEELSDEEVPAEALPAALEPVVPAAARVLSSTVDCSAVEDSS